MDEANAILAKAAQIEARDGDLEKARKLAQQALNLGQTEANDLLHKIDTKLAAKKANSEAERRKEAESRPESEENRRENEKRRIEEKRKEAEEIRKIERIKNCNDLYERLGINREASDSDIRSAYKKLALRYHPDKNSTPGSAEAFKAISQAYSILSDADKRRNYDNKSLRVNGASENFAHHHHEYFNEDIDPNEIFRMFFGHGFVFDNNMFYRANMQRMHRRHQHQNMDLPRRSLWIQFLPVIVFLGASFLMNLFHVDPQYQFKQSSQYSNKIVTTKREVTAFVTDDFLRRNQGHIPRDLEDKIEDDYRTYLANLCYREEQERYYLIDMGRIQGRTDIIDRANSMDLPNCRKLKSFVEYAR